MAPAAKPRTAMSRARTAVRLMRAVYRSPVAGVSDPGLPVQRDSKPGSRTPATGARLIRPLALEHRRHGEQQQLHVEPEAALADVLDVELHLLLERQVAAA